MVDEQLAAYVKSMLKEGYTPEAIKTQLLRYGYSSSDVEAALGKSHRILIAITFVILVVFGAIALLFFFRFDDKTDEVSLIITIEPEYQVPVGSVLSFTLTVESDTPQSATYGHVTYRVANSQGVVEASKEEQLSLSQTRISDSLLLPQSLKTGSYTLIAEATVNGNEFTDSASFNIIEDDPVRFSRENHGPPSLEEGKQISAIVTLSGEDASHARDLCLDFTSQQAVDQCLLESALSTNNELFCPDIIDADKRDTCYFNIMLILGKRELCGSITNRNLKGTCLQI